MCLRDPDGPKVVVGISDFGSGDLLFVRLLMEEDDKDVKRLAYIESRGSASPICPTRVLIPLCLSPDRAFGYRVLDLRADLHHMFCVWK